MPMHAQKGKRSCVQAKCTPTKEIFFCGSRGNAEIARSSISLDDVLSRSLQSSHCGTQNNHMLSILCCNDLLTEHDILGVLIANISLLQNFLKFCSSNREVAL